MSRSLSQIRTDLGLGTGSFSLSQLRTLSPEASASPVSLSQVVNDAKFKGLTSWNPSAKASDIKAGTGRTQDGLYWINFNGTPRKTLCLLDTKWFGGGWIALDKDSFPVTSNALTTASWASNTVNFFGFNSSQLPHIVQVNVREAECGGNSFYEIAGTNTNNTVNPIAERMLFMVRVNILGQCTVVTNSTSRGYVDTPSSFSGESSLVRHANVCNWGDNIWAHRCCSSTFTSASILKRNWVFQMRTNSNTGTGYRWSNRCGPGQTGTHYHLWFYRENDDIKVPPSYVTEGRLFVDPAYPESYSTTTSTALFNLTPINTSSSTSLDGSHTFNSSTGTISLNNTSANVTLNTARVGVASMAIRSISVWFYARAMSVHRFFLDARPALTDGYIWSGGGGEWTTSSMYVNNSTTTISATWNNIQVVNEWRCITIVRPAAFTGAMTLFRRHTNDSGMNIEFGPIFISSSATSAAEHIAFYEKYLPRYQ
jgi:hypothetical protein